MLRFFLFSVFGLLATCALVATTYSLLVHFGFSTQEVRLHSLSEFDFSSYAFGLVAVALSFAGIYISVILDNCNDLLYKLLEVHFTPLPFQDMSDLERKCSHHYINQITSLSPGLCCVQAIVGLKRWSALNDSTKANLLGSKGLSASRNWFGSVFRFFQSGRDRLIVASIGVSTALIYVALPVSYWLKFDLLATSMMYAMYVMCVIEIFICAVLYFVKWFFIRGVGKEMPKWHPEIEMSMIVATTNRATGAPP